MAIGLEAIEVFKAEITKETFFNDILGSIPIVSKYINQRDRINIYYNNYALNLKNTSQIVSMVVTSVAYFSTFFCWILSDICIILLMLFDSKNKKTKNNFIGEYMSLYLSFIFSFVIFSNVQTLIGNLFVNYIPIVGLVFLDSKIKMKHKDNKGVN